MSFDSEVNSLKKQLFSSLNDGGNQYLKFMKMWFSMKLTKEKFDESVRNIIPPELISLHNRFLLAILNKCQTLSVSSPSSNISAKSRSLTTALKLESSPIKKEKPEIWEKPEQKAETLVKIESETPEWDSKEPKVKVEQEREKERFTTPTSSPVKHERAPCVTKHDEDSRSPPKKKQKTTKTKIKRNESVLPSEFQHRHSPASVWKYLRAQPSTPGPPQKEALLPSSGHLKGRFMIGAWENGLLGAEDEAIDLLSVSMRQLLKSVLQSIISWRGGYKLRNGCFPHSFGADAPNPWLKSSRGIVDDESEPLRMDSSPERCLSDEEQRSAFELSLGAQRVKEKLPLTVRELFPILMVLKASIQSHHIFSLLMERASAKLWHPSYEELETNICDDDWR